MEPMDMEAVIQAKQMIMNIQNMTGIVQTLVF